MAREKIQLENMFVVLLNMSDMDHTPLTLYIL